MENLIKFAARFRALNLQDPCAKALIQDMLLHLEALEKSRPMNTEIRFGHRGIPKRTKD